MFTFETVKDERISNEIEYTFNGNLSGMKEYQGVRTYFIWNPRLKAILGLSKTRFLAIYEVKWGHFNVEYSTLKVLPRC